MLIEKHLFHKEMKHNICIHLNADVITALAEQPQ